LADCRKRGIIPSMGILLPGVEFPKLPTHLQVSDSHFFFQHPANSRLTSYRTIAYGDLDATIEFNAPPIDAWHRRNFLMERSSAHGYDLTDQSPSPLIKHTVPS
jgi:hypothetical protein